MALYRFDMDTYYHVTAMKVMRLRSQETLSGRKEFIVVGATAVVGEEVNAKGKVCVFYGSDMNYSKYLHVAFWHYKQDYNTHLVLDYINVNYYRVIFQRYYYACIRVFRFGCLLYFSCKPNIVHQYKALLFTLPQCLHMVALPNDFL